MSLPDPVATAAPAKLSTAQLPLLAAVGNGARVQRCMCFQVGVSRCVWGVLQELTTGGGSVLSDPGVGLALFKGLPLPCVLLCPSPAVAMIMLSSGHTMARQRAYTPVATAFSSPPVVLQSPCPLPCSSCAAPDSVCVAWVALLLGCTPLLLWLLQPPPSSMSPLCCGAAAGHGNAREGVCMLCMVRLVWNGRV